MISFLLDLYFSRSYIFYRYIKYLWLIFESNFDMINETFIFVFIFLKIIIIYQNSFDKSLHQLWCWYSIVKYSSSSDNTNCKISKRFVKCFKCIKKINRYSFPKFLFIFRLCQCVCNRVLPSTTSTLSNLLSSIFFTL